MTGAAIMRVPRRSDTMTERGLLAWSTRGLLFLTMAICVVVPHSFQVPTAALLVLTALVSVFGLRWSEWLGRLMLLYCAGVAITVIYVWVGYSKGAPRDAVLQIIQVYIFAPLIWLILGSALVQRVGQDRTIRWLLLFTMLALFSVVAFFYAFITFGKDSVKFLTEDANVNVQGGFAGASMLVYGSMIFLSGAFFAEPTLMRWRIGRLVMPAALIVCALTSGRSAFIIAIPIGYIVGFFLRPRLAVGVSDLERKQSSLLPTLIMIVAGTLGLFILSTIFQQLDLRLIVNLFWDKLTSGGGDVRVEQASALWQGVEDSYGLGAGHGLGVRYLRSEEFPWRYELIPLATMLRVGMLGTLVYCSPFLLYLGLLGRRYARIELSRADVYMAGGFFAAAAAAFTNPYIESFIFQWMFFLPVVALGSTLGQNHR